ncbi:MAG: hypothetical protein A2X77_04660 [Gammaproteobacteria bacterium GWE2_42_36]|nr:MAG: hypothetical protein A2X77_04660 [Gammaproteobacteria bacterium GWE2_42_36]
MICIDFSENPAQIFIRYRLLQEVKTKQPSIPCELILEKTDPEQLIDLQAVPEGSDRISFFDGSSTSEEGNQIKLIFNLPLNHLSVTQFTNDLKLLCSRISCSKMILRYEDTRLNPTPLTVNDAIITITEKLIGSPSEAVSLSSPATQPIASPTLNPEPPAMQKGLPDLAPLMERCSIAPLSLPPAAATTTSSLHRILVPRRRIPAAIQPSPQRSLGAYRFQASLLQRETVASSLPPLTQLPLSLGKRVSRLSSFSDSESSEEERSPQRRRIEPRSPRQRFKSLGEEEDTGERPRPR